MRTLDVLPAPRGNLHVAHGEEAARGREHEDVPHCVVSFERVRYPRRRDGVGFGVRG
jgi:hypothetical protein